MICTLTPQQNEAFLAAVYAEFLLMQKQSKSFILKDFAKSYYDRALAKTSDREYALGIVSKLPGVIRANLNKKIVLSLVQKQVGDIVNLEEKFNNLAEVEKFLFSAKNNTKNKEKTLKLLKDKIEAKYKSLPKVEVDDSTVKKLETEISELKESRDNKIWVEIKPSRSELTFKRITNPQLFKSKDADRSREKREEINQELDKLLDVLDCIK